MEQSDIEIDCVPILKYCAVRDSVADDFIHRSDRGQKMS